MTVSIRYRQYTHKTLVDYGRRSADCSRVSNIEAFGDADKLHAAEHSWQGQDDVSVHHASEWSGDGAADADQMAICSYVADNPILDFANNHGASILHDRTQASSPLGTQPLVTMSRTIRLRFRSRPTRRPYTRPSCKSWSCTVQQNVPHSMSHLSTKISARSVL